MTANVWNYATSVLTVTDETPSGAFSARLLARVAISRVMQRLAG